MVKQFNLLFIDDYWWSALCNFEIIKKIYEFLNFRLFHPLNNYTTNIDWQIVKHVRCYIKSFVLRSIESQTRLKVIDPIYSFSKLIVITY